MLGKSRRFLYEYHPHSIYKLDVYNAGGPPKEMIIFSLSQQQQAHKTILGPTQNGGKSNLN